MEIEGRKIHSEEEILTALQDEFDEFTEYVTMDNGDDFIQTSGGELQYRAEGKNYRVSDFPVAQEKIKEAFLSYYRGDGKYLSDFSWEEIFYESIWTKIKKLFKK